MNICYLLAGFDSGGIGRVVSILANQQVKMDKYKIYIVTLFPAKNEEIYELSKLVNREVLVYSRPKSVRKVLFLAARKLHNFVKKNNIDVLIACGNVFYPIALLAGIFTKTRVICWEHSNVFNVNDNIGQTQLRWLACKLADCIVVLTDCDKKGYEQKFNTNKVVRIYNPIDPKLYSAKLNNKSEFVKKFKIVSVGRFSYQKHFEVIPEIALALSKYSLDWEWHIFGSGKTMPKVQNIVKKFSLENKIVFEGQVGNLYERYSEFDIMVMTSRYEGFPMTLLEGCANGIPLVSFDVLTGPNEIIKDGENGFLVDEGNINDCAEKINCIMKNKHLRESLSYKSKLTAKKFDIINIVEQWDDLLNNVVKNSEVRKR